MKTSVRAAFASHRASGIATFEKLHAQPVSTSTPIAARTRFW